MNIDIPDNWLPTSENINALPEPVRKYIHDLHATTDQAVLVRENVLLRDQVRALSKLLEER